MKNTITNIIKISQEEQYIKNIVIAGIFILSTFVGMYMYFVGKIVFDVVARRQAETEIKLAQSSVGKLQVAYLNQLNSVDIASASQIGLYESKDVLYASRISQSPTVGMLQ
jgi:hypothetical protein